MKVCFLTHNLKQINGAGVFSRRLIDGLARELNCKYVVLTTEAGGFNDEKPILYPQRLKLIKEFLNIRKIIKECDVVHALDAYPYGAIAVLANWGLGKKIIITAIGTGAIAPLYKPFYSWLLKYAYYKADVVTAISRFTQREILKKIKKTDIQVITHGVNLKDFSGGISGIGNRLNKFKPYILSVGSLRWRKGYKLSIRAFTLISKKIPDLKYVIVGKRYSDKYFDQLNEIINELHLKDKVFIFENIDDRNELSDIYRNAELFCLLSQNRFHDMEGFGLVFLEAAASGLPVVGSRGSGIEDAVSEGENGYLVDPQNIEEFSEATIKILNDKELKESMAKKSLAFARASLWDSKIGEYAKIYKKILI